MTPLCAPGKTVRKQKSALTLRAPRQPNATLPASLLRHSAHEYGFLITWIILGIIIWCLSALGVCIIPLFPCYVNSGCFYFSRSIDVDGGGGASWNICYGPDLCCSELMRGNCSQKDPANLPVSAAAIVFQILQTKIYEIPKTRLDLASLFRTRHSVCSCFRPIQYQLISVPYLFTMTFSLRVSCSVPFA